MRTDVQSVETQGQMYEECISKIDVINHTYNLERKRIIKVIPSLPKKFLKTEYHKVYTNIGKNKTLLYILERTINKI